MAGRAEINTPSKRIDLGLAGGKDRDGVGGLI